MHTPVTFSQLVELGVIVGCCGIVDFHVSFAVGNLIVVVREFSVVAEAVEFRVSLAFCSNRLEAKL
jgi:hypothetical protein